MIARRFECWKCRVLSEPILRDNDIKCTSCGDYMTPGLYDGDEFLRLPAVIPSYRLPLAYPEREEVREIEPDPEPEPVRRTESYNLFEGV